MMDSTFLIKLRAIMMALLLSLFPIHYSFLVTASTHSSSPFIDVRFIAGEDGFEGFRRSSDSETIVVHASFGDGTPVTPDSINLRVGEHSRGDFDSCTSVSGSEGIYECTYTATDLFPFVSARTSYHVRLFSGPNQVAASATGHLVVDNVAPRIDTFEIREQRTNKPNVSVSFSVADQAHSGFPGIGVKALRLTSDGTTYFQYPAEGESAPEVTDTDLARRPVSQSNLVVPVRTTSGSSEICLYAEDYMGNEREECKTVTVDVTPPTIRTDTFQVRMADGTEVGWVSDEPVSLRVSIVVEGSNFESLVGDFSSIHSSLSSMQPDCSSLGSDSRNCTFSIDNVHINRTHSFVFNATDDLGNSAVTSLSEPFQHDNTPPVATGLQTSLFADGQSYIARSPVNITVTFRETGVGMADEEAYLDLSDLGLDVQQADNCTQGSTTWSCYWTDISPDINRIRGLQKLQIPIVDVYEYEGINGMEYEEEITYIDLEAYRAQLRITPDTCDDLVNCAEQRVFNVTVDIDPPRVEKEDIQLVNVPGSNNDFPDIRVVGDGIFITANVTDATPVRINVSTTHFYNNTPRFSMVRECTDLGDGTHQCSVNLPPITREGYYVGSLTVSFIDTLGNTRTHTLDNLEVLSIADEQVMIWNGYSRLCTPHALDRELAGKSGFRNSVYCAMGLRTDYDAEIYHMRRGVCTDVTPETPLTGRQNTIVDLSWLGLGARQPLVYANLLLSNFDPRIDKLVYECQVHVRSVVTTNNNRYITRMYQPVNVTFELELYNSPLGELDQVLYDEAKSIYDSYIGSGWDTVTRLRNFFDLSSQICRIGMSIQRILNAGRSLGLLFGGLSQALGSNPLTASAGISSQLNSAAANQATDGAAEGFKRFWQKWMGKYCAFISCKLHFGDAWTAAGNFQQTCSAAFSLMSDPARYLLPTDVGAILSADQRASETPRPDGTGTDSSADAETVEPTFWTRAQQSVVHTPWRGEAGERYHRAQQAERQVQNIDSQLSSLDMTADQSYAQRIADFNQGKADAQTSVDNINRELSSLDMTADQSYAQRIADFNQGKANAQTSVDNINRRLSSLESNAQRIADLNQGKADAQTRLDNINRELSSLDMTDQSYAQRIADLNQGKADAQTSVDNINRELSSLDMTADQSYAQRIADLNQWKANAQTRVDNINRRLSSLESNAQRIADLNQWKADAQTRVGNISTLKDAAKEESKEGGFGNWWTGETTLLSVPGDPRDNYILAVCTLCIPGIIYNLEKYRQMKCELGNCLISTANGGIPIEVCRAQYAYAECKYIFGPIFELMPFTQFLSQVGRFVANLLANPSLAIDVTMGFFCQTQIGAQIICRTGPPCTEPNLEVYACLIYDTFGVFMDIYNDITGYVDGGFFSNVNLNGDSGSCAAFAENFERLSARD